VIDRAKTKGHANEAVVDPPTIEGVAKLRVGWEE
jgi:hypothetical protein